jgi:hypothetical protein
MAFNFNKYKTNNPLFEEVGDYVSDEEFDTMNDDELDDAGLSGDEPLGPNEEFEPSRQRLSGEEISEMARISGVKIKESVKLLMNAGYEKGEIQEFISLLMKTL